MDSPKPSPVSVVASMATGESLTVNANAQRSTDPSPAHSRKRRRGWWVLAALGAGALFTALLCVALLLFLTSPEPISLPETNITEEARDALMDQWVSFQHDVTSRRPTKPLQVSSQDLNVFVSMMPRLRARVYGTFQANRIRCQFTMPLSARPKSRYFNGVATVRMSLKGGQLNLEVTSCTINGHSLPSWACRQLGRKCFNPEAFWLFEDSNILPHLKSIEVRDDCLMVIPLRSE